MTRKPLTTWRNPGLGAVLSVLLLLCVGIGLPTAPPAFAHDQLISSSPAPDETLPTAPTGITLTFSSPLLTLGHEVRVIDGEGRNRVDRAAELTRETLTQPLPDLPDGAYQVAWRVVSADGHPISGSFGFRVGDPAAAAPQETIQPTATPAASEGTETLPGAGTPGWLPAAGIGGVAALGLFLAFTSVRRIRRTTHSSTE